MTSVTSNEDITRVGTARPEKRKREHEQAYEADFDALRRKVVERVRGLEARVRELEARVEVAETQRDAMRAELEAARRTPEEETGLSSLPLDVISTHILRSVFLPEPGDLGRLRAVSRRMRDAVDATGREIRNLSDWKAMDLGYVSLLKDRHSRGVLTNDSCLCIAAARSGQLEDLKWARANFCPWDRDTCAGAAEGGHLEMLKWARENDCPWDWRTCAYAAWGGHLEMLKWARANGCPWYASTCAYAAKGGHLEVLKWARENSCPLDANTCTYAAEGGHLEMLKWARANGCPWDEATREFAASKGYVET